MIDTCMPHISKTKKLSNTDYITNNRTEQYSMQYCYSRVK